MISSHSTALEPTAVRSMTGFARIRRTEDDAEIVVSLKTVNHRSLDMHFHCPAELDALENEMRALVRRKLTRGHVEIRVSVNRSASAPSMKMNRAMLNAYLHAYRDAAAEHHIASTPDLNAAFRIPGMFSEDAEPELGAGLQQQVLAAVSAALDELNRVREREAGELIAFMLRQNQAIEKAASELSAIRDRAVPMLQARLNDRLRELLAQQSVDPQRLAQEVAILVDRSDVSEEIARLRIHAGQLESLLKGGGEVGKKLDFLLQEMNRETNTILSKTTGIGEIGLRITELALGAKAEIEKIREQSLNLE